MNCWKKEILCQKISRKSSETCAFTLTTNDKVLSDQITEFLVKHNVLTAFSVDGIESSHNKMHKMADGHGSFQFAVKSSKYQE